MDSRDIPQPHHQQLQTPTPLGMLMSHHYPNFNTEAMMGPNSIHPRLTFGSLAPLPPQMDNKTLESLGHVDEVSPSSQPMRFRIDQNQNEQPQVKRKRGRPRKYTPDGTIALGLAGDGDRVDTNSADPPAKRTRGRPPGSTKKQFDALGTSSVAFTPHIIDVEEGEDILSKVVAFSSEGPGTVSVLSATGAVSETTFRNSSGIDTHKGRFDIVKLSGSLFNYEVNGTINRSGSLTVSLAGPSNQVFGGIAAGPLVAATPVKVIVGSFVEEAKKLKQSSGNNAGGQNPEPASAPVNNMLNFVSNSQGPSSESSDENEIGSPSMMHHDNNNNGIYGNTMAQQLRQMQMYNLWPSSGQ